MIIAHVCVAWSYWLEMMKIVWQLLVQWGIWDCFAFLLCSCFKIKCWFRNLFIVRTGSLRMLFSGMEWCGRGRGSARKDILRIEHTFAIAMDIGAEIVGTPLTIHQLAQAIDETIIFIMSIIRLIR